MQDLIVRVGADISGLSNSLRMASQQVTQFAQRSQQGLQAIGNVGKTMATIGAAGVAGLGASVKAAIDFESAFAGVRKTVDATEKEFAQFEKEIRAMAKEIPAAATEIAAVAEAAGQLGIEKENLMGFTRVMIDLGVATNLSSDEAATALARLANITQMPQDQFDRLGATIVDLGNNLATTEADIVHMALRIAGAGNQIGLTEAQILSFAGALSSVGIEAEMGGSAISRVMIEIANAVNIGGDYLGQFAKVAGVSSADFKKAFEKDAAEAVVMFIEGLDRMSKSGENVFMVLDELGLSEIRVRDTLLRAAGAGDLFRKTLDLGNKAWEENVALTNEAEERYKTLESQLKILWNHIKEVGISVGQALTPAIKLLIQGIQNALNWFINLSDASKRFLAIGFAVSSLFTLLGGSMLILLAFIPSIVQGFGLIATSLGMSSAALLRMILMVGGLVGGIALLVTALVLAYNEIEWLNKAVKAVGRGIVDGFKIATQAVEDFGGYLSNLAITTWPIIVSGAGVAVDAVKRFGEAMEPKLITAYTWALEGLGKVSELIGKGVQKLADSGITVMDVLRNLAGPATTLLTIFLGLQGPIGLVASALMFLATRTNIVTDMIKVFKDEMYFADAIKNMGDAVTIFISKMSIILEKAIEVGADFIVKFIEGIAANLPTLIAKSTEIVTTVIETIVNKIPTLVAAGTTAITNIIQGITEALPVILEAAISIITALISGIADALPLLLEAGINILTGLVTAISDSLPTILDAGIKIINTLIDGIVTVLPELTFVGINSLSTIVGAIIEGIPALIGAGISIVDAVINGIITVLPTLIKAALDILNALLNAISDNLPLILNAGIDVLLALIGGLIKAIPSLLKAALDIISALSKALLDSLPQLFDAGVKILLALIDGIIDILPQLIALGIKLVYELSKAVLSMLPQILKAGGEILLALAKGIWSLVKNLAKTGIDLIKEFLATIEFRFPEVYKKGGDLLKKIIDGVKSGIGNMVSIGADIINGLVRGIWSMADKAWEAAKNVAKGVGNTIKSALGIKSPSRVTMALGVNVGEGFIIGIERMVGGVKQAADEMANAALPDENELSLAYSVPNVSPLGASYSAAGTAEKSNAEIMSDTLADAIRGLQVVMDGREVGKVVETTRDKAPKL